MKINLNVFIVKDKWINPHSSALYKKIKLTFIKNNVSILNLILIYYYVIFRDVIFINENK